MNFIHKCLRYSQFLIVALMMFAVAILPRLPLGAENNKETQGSEANFRDLETGIYLYGQSSKPYEIGKEYILFEVTEEKLIGVLYMPHSSFSCFEGKTTENQLEMLVDHPYEDSFHDYAIALEETSPVASRSEQVKAPLQLKGYVPVEEINSNDRRMLATCQEKF
ncbi:hypothetical protein FRE64_13835 [Euhalothece natronophila Z-M001]|uniref:Uncharacterized protein n=1 Tax=Euhalothece natronophila Z-M001 TaxID=522448 RepID=A0A5B8NPK2_9CHRO|nr:hypothetical protein [Euhalothece natronophila]QDZ40927.1 hypothetical protein FRE64_13835 [Euhalothece natronophila Z-M001]